MKYPCGAALDREGFLWVCNTHDHAILKLDTCDGSIVGRWGATGTEPGELRYPVSIAFGFDENIVIVDEGNNRVQVFDNQMNFKFAFGGTGASGQLNDPCGVAIDLEGNIVIADSGNNRIEIFSPKGVWVNGFLGVSNPIGIAVNSKGQIVVMDNGNQKVKIFEPNGVFVLEFGDRGSRPGLFNHPWGLCVDRNDSIIVCDQANARIQFFDSGGNFLSEIGRWDDRYCSPYTPVIDLDGTLYVTDQSCIQVFTENNTKAKK